MTIIRNPLAALLLGLSLSLISACGPAEDDSRAQMQPTLSEGPDPAKLVHSGTMDFTITKPTINRMWGSGASDIWGVGQAAVVVHWDGKVWQRIAVPTGSTLLAEVQKLMKAETGKKTADDLLFTSFVTQ